MQHDICYLTYNDRLGIAPPCDSDAKVGRVLDLGTGTGLWAIDFADQHPEAEVGMVQKAANWLQYYPVCVANR